MSNYFAELNGIDVSDHVEKKGQFSYLSWAYAIAELKSRHPDATWEVRRFDNLPYLKTELGYFVEVLVTVAGITHSQIHPVLDNNNRVIKEPNAFHINTSIQRALVKAIALHGLGLFIYAGEDLPESVKEEVQAVKAELEAAAKDGKEAFAEKWSGLTKGQRELIGKDEFARIKGLIRAEPQAA